MGHGRKERYDKGQNTLRASGCPPPLEIVPLFTHLRTEKQTSYSWLTSEEPVCQSPLLRRRRKAAVKQRTCSECWWLDDRLPLNLRIPTNTQTLHFSLADNGFNQKKPVSEPTWLYRLGAGASTAAFTPAAEGTFTARSQILIAEVERSTLKENNYKTQGRMKHCFLPAAGERPSKPKYLNWTKSFKFNYNCISLILNETKTQFSYNT